MQEKNRKWLRIADHLDDIHFGDNNIALAAAGDKKICIGRFEGTLFAFASRCPHAGGALYEACINRAGHIVCPVHGYKFNIRTGYNVSGEGYYLMHWEVVVKPDGVFVNMEE